MTFSERDATMDALTRALPYLHHYRGRIFVLKAGGALCGDGARCARWPIRWACFGHWV